MKRGFQEQSDSVPSGEGHVGSVHNREYQQLQAFIFAIDEINRNPEILPNVTLGYHVYDSCGYIMKVMQDVLHILSGPKLTAPNYNCMEHGTLAGFIGDLQSVTTLPMAQLLNFYGYTQMPHGLCSAICLPGSRKSLREGYPICCYDCIPCSEGEISNATDSEDCHKCPDDEWPNERKDMCIPRRVEFLSYKKDTIATVFSAMSGLYFILTVFIIGIFISFRDTPIVKASNRNLSLILLISLKLSVLCVYLFIGRPVDITCMLRQISFGIIFTIAVSSILAKTVMVYIAFKASRPGSSWRKWLGVKLPNSVVLVCSSVQVITSALWLSVSPPTQGFDRDSYPGMIIIQCNEGSVIAFYFMLGYMGFLAAVSFGLAFMVRTLPDNYNEAKYITFSMLVLCSVWVCAIPAYLSSKGKHMVIVEVFAILASEIGILSCIFFPKCYNILLRPEINNKRCLLEKSCS
ncbi:vomeronasal type-2 receptor 26-like [Pseudophryne corroboree]|uniref:vomeronasal type-2 receptor 26-like n=1 Tax=Pseudophryne corroboree TaxID=495146 RepID=UPI003081AA4A